jgi:light-regulated signal transduction histidine kinase (bacteriophytochrome)
MEADLQASKPSSTSDASEATALRVALKEKEQELLQRKRFDEELYSLINMLERKLTDGAVQLATARQEMMLEKQRQLECQLEIARLTDILVREQDTLTTLSQEIEAFNYGISHDLRAPLRHLLGFSAALGEEYSGCLDGTAHGYLKSIQRAAGRMEMQIEALLTLSRISRQELRATTVDLGRLAQERAETLRAAHPQRDLALKLGAGLAVQADLIMMQAAIGHLIDNAWKFTGNRERATVEFGRKEDRGCTIFYLRDNGAGFDMRYADRLFGPFQRMHKESEFDGVGVGLATVQRIIHRHGGKIWANAEVGVGATFYFTLSP